MVGQQSSNSSGSEAQSPIPIDELGMRQHTSSVTRMIALQERQFPWNPKPGTRKPSKPLQSIPNVCPQCESRRCHKPIGMEVLGKSRPGEENLLLNPWCFNNDLTRTRTLSTHNKQAGMARGEGFVHVLAIIAVSTPALCSGLGA